jgi:hypothetical protein
MFQQLIARLRGRRVEAAQLHEEQREHMTDAERRLDDESFEDRQADLVTRARLGGNDPERLLPDDDPSHH